MTSDGRTRRRSPRKGDYVQMHIRVREKDAKAVDDAADEEGVTVTSWVCTAIRQRLTKLLRAKKQ